MTGVLDLVFLIIIVVCVIDGYKQGFVKSLLSLVIGVVSIVLAFVLTNNLWQKMSDAVTPATSDRTEFFTAFIGFIAVYLIIMIVSRILLTAAGLLNKVPVVGFLNRIFGVIFGFAGAVVTIFLLSVLYDIFILYTGRIGSGELSATDTSLVLNTLLGNIPF
ncbi:MAG: CvpA family protein [Ruminococcus sp.]|jgi:membrane protein required for colicin V production|nr:CvpA family protein [Ruminococcus sp.]